MESCLDVTEKLGKFRRVSDFIITDGMSEFREHSERGVDEYRHTADLRKEVSTLPTPRAWGCTSGVRSSM